MALNRQLSTGMLTLFAFAIVRYLPILDPKVEMSQVNLSVFALYNYIGRESDCFIVGGVAQCS